MLYIIGVKSKQDLKHHHPSLLKSRDKIKMLFPPILDYKKASSLQNNQIIQRNIKTNQGFYGINRYQFYYVLNLL